MLVITTPPPIVPAAALAGKERDTLRLTWEERRWTRKRVPTAAGRGVALALATGSVLKPGDVLAVEKTWYLIVEARAEPVIAVRPRDHDEAIRVAFEVGNRTRSDLLVIDKIDGSPRERRPRRHGARHRAHAGRPPVHLHQPPRWRRSGRGGRLDSPRTPVRGLSALGLAGLVLSRAWPFEGECWGPAFRSMVLE
jgi:hypothetical protein